MSCTGIERYGVILLIISNQSINFRSVVDNFVVA